MDSYTYPTSVLPVLRACTPAAKLAHPTTVGFLAVQDAVAGKGAVASQGAGAAQGLLARQGDAIGGSLLESRSITFDVRIQPTNGANGISGSAAQGSPMVDVPVPAETKARGVPPRGRPV
jgi:hypothetical protein